jgi:DNA-binding CsgD family transcriptional regulator
VDDIASEGGDHVAMDHRVEGPSSERAGVDLAALSEREREVLELALRGLPARAIAERLTLTEATIRSHLARIYAKLGVGGRVELLTRFRTQRPDEGRSLPAPSVQTAPPRRRRVWPVVALAVLLVMVGAGALFLWLRPDLPPTTNLVTVSQLVAQGQATSLDLRGDTLFVTTADGHRYRVDGVDASTFREIFPKAMAAGAVVRISPGDDTNIFVSNVGFLAVTLPAVLLLVTALVAFRWLRRPPQPRPAA